LFAVQELNYPDFLTECNKKIFIGNGKPIGKTYWGFLLYILKRTRHAHTRAICARSKNRARKLKTLYVYTVDLTILFFNT